MQRVEAPFGQQSGSDHLALIPFLKEIGLARYSCFSIGDHVGGFAQKISSWHSLRQRIGGLLGEVFRVENLLDHFGLRYKVAVFITAILAAVLESLLMLTLA